MHKWERYVPILISSAAQRSSVNAPFLWVSFIMLGDFG